MKRIYKFIVIIISIFTLIILYESLNAFDDGITGLTRRGGNTEGCTCHSLTPFREVRVIIIAPSMVQSNDTVECQLRISGGPLVAGGCDIASASGDVITSPADTALQRLLSSFNNYELTHKYPKFPLNDTVVWFFRYIAPGNAGTDTIFANGNSVNFNGMPTGDEWDYAVNKVIIVGNRLGISGITSTSKGFHLNQNYPNPFNPSTNIKYQISRNGFVNLKVYDITGREISTLVNSVQKAGEYVVKFSSENYLLSSGVYYYKLSVQDNISPTGYYSDVKKMILIK